MFKAARIKLTAWYLLIITAISLSFSGAIYVGVDRELNRIASFQRTRIQGIIRGFPVPVDVSYTADTEAINEARLRIITALAIINASILFFSGVGGYFLAGQTLDPIAEMMEEQKAFVSDASHELRTPLTSLMTEIEVALRNKHLGLPEAKKMLASNLEEVKKMNNLSNYLLTLNKLQDGQVDTKFTDVDLKNVASKSVKKVEPIASAKNIKIVQKLINSSIHGNPETIEELMTILLDNAIKYSPKGKNITLKIIKNGFSVADNGVGIAKEDLPHIFDRFYRADLSRNKEKTEGYGLGLSIAKSIADLHDAKIVVRSISKNGSTFIVYFRTSKRHS